MYMYPQRANTPLHSLCIRAMTVGTTSGPTAKLEPSFGPISPVVGLHGQQRYFGKADQSTLASGGSEDVQLHI